MITVGKKMFDPSPLQIRMNHYKLPQGGVHFAKPSKVVRDESMRKYIVPMKAFLDDAAAATAAA